MKVSIKFNNKTNQVITEMVKQVDLGVKKSTRVAERNIKIMTPVVTGTLRRSIHSRDIKLAESEVYSAETADGKIVEYAEYVEYGTIHFAPRAMFRKGIAMSENEIERIMNEGLRKVQLAELKESIIKRS